MAHAFSQAGVTQFLIEVGIAGAVIFFALVAVTVLGRLIGAFRN